MALGGRRPLTDLQWEMLLQQGDGAEAKVRHQWAQKAHQMVLEHVRLLPGVPVTLVLRSHQVVISDDVALAHRAVRRAAHNERLFVGQGATPDEMLRAAVHAEMLLCPWLIYPAADEEIMKALIAACRPALLRELLVHSKRHALAPTLLSRGALRLLMDAEAHVNAWCSGLVEAGAALTIEGAAAQGMRLAAACLDLQPFHLQKALLPVLDAKDDPEHRVQRALLQLGGAEEYGPS